jgi:hypothetical protein
MPEHTLYPLLAPTAPRRTTSAGAGADSILAEMMELGHWGEKGGGRYGVSPIDRRVLRTAAGASASTLLSALTRARRIGKKQGG